MGIFRKSQKVSAHHLGPKGVLKGVLNDPGPEDPPDPDRGSLKNF